ADAGAHLQARLEPEEAGGRHGRDRQGDRRAREEGSRGRPFSGWFRRSCGLRSESRPGGTPRVTAPDPAKKLGSLPKKLRASYGESRSDSAGEGRPESADPLLWQLVYSFLAWESTPAKATTANKRLHAAVVDYNEMRVCLGDELAGIIGD